jgi:hypothetical protein
MVRLNSLITPRLGALVQQDRYLASGTENSRDEMSKSLYPLDSSGTNITDINILGLVVKGHPLCLKNEGNVFIYINEFNCQLLLQYTNVCLNSLAYAIACWLEAEIRIVKLT